MGIPILYTGIHFRRTGSIFIGFVLIVFQAPFLAMQVSENSVYGINYMVAMVVITVLSVHLGHVIRKGNEEYAMMQRCREILIGLIENATADMIFRMLEKQFSELGKSETVEIFLLDENDQLKSRLNPEDEPLPDDHIFYKVIQDGKYLLSNNVLEDTRFEYYGPAEEMEAVSQLLAFRLAFGGRNRGIIVLANSGLERLGSETIKLLETIIKFIENALEIVEKRHKTIMHEMQREKIRDTFSSYVSRTVAEEILKDSSKLNLGGKRQNVTVMFTEITNFKDILKTTEPELLLDMLNRYFSIAIDTIYETKGTLDKFIGDNVMAFWGAPLAMDDSELRAVNCAVDFLKKMNDQNALWRDENKEEFKISIGINSGEVVAGNLGSIRRMEYTIIGDTVNTASRIKSFSKKNSVPILIGESTYMKVKDRVDFSGVHKASVKGKSDTINVYQLIV
ncbi:MAG TPA: adenylate/guanylate cyclase domain-containing protein [bacterium]|nr:adenylate/guanylate cyclase domain-containing protein [bacterium]